jgi:hypothetical protein
VEGYKTQDQYLAASQMGKAAGLCTEYNIDHRALGRSAHQRVALED